VWRRDSESALPLKCRSGYPIAEIRQNLAREHREPRVKAEALSTFALPRNARALGGLIGIQFARPLRRRVIEICPPTPQSPTPARNTRASLTPVTAATHSVRLSVTHRARPGRPPPWR